MSVSQVYSAILTTNQTVNALSDENVHIVVYIYVQYASKKTFHKRAVQRYARSH